MSPNFAPLDLSQPEVAILVGAMVQARDAVERRVVVCIRKSRQTKNGGPMSLPIRARGRESTVRAICRLGARSTGWSTSRAGSSASPAVSAIGRQLFGGPI